MRIQRYPFGFLAALDAKSTGFTPADLLDEVRPVFSLGEYYLASIALQSTSSSQTGCNTFGDGPTITIPANQAWQVLSVSCSVNAAAAAITRLKAGIAVLPPQNSQGVFVASAADGLADATEILCTNWAPSQPQIFGPGTGFWARINQTIATTVTVGCAVLYRALPV